MPNWTHHRLHVVGPKRLVARWWRYSRMDPQKLPGGWADPCPWISFLHLCPPRTTAERRQIMTMPSGVVLLSWRTRTQASLSFICAWVYPKHFFREVPRHWPGLALWCMVEEESSAFGGIVTVREGRRRDLVKSQGAGYDAREHAQRVGREMKQWRQLVGTERSFSLRPGRTNGKIFDVDATFDADESRLYFRTEAECRQFRARYGGTKMACLVGGRWLPLRALSRGQRRARA